MHTTTCVNLVSLAIRRDGLNGGRDLADGDRGDGSATLSSGTRFGELRRRLHGARRCVRRACVPSRRGTSAVRTTWLKDGRVHVALLNRTASASAVEKRETAALYTHA